MMKNNLKAQNNEKNFVKIRSFSSLLYAIATCIVASFTGNLYNINPYIPMYCSISICVFTFVLSFFYKEPKEYESLNNKTRKLDFSFFKNKKFFLLSLALIFTMGTIMFYHSNSTLLLQTILQNENMQLSSITLIISYIVLASRLFRIAGVYLAPLIYKKIKNKSLILCSALFIVSSLFYSLGACINKNLFASVTLVSIGLMILISLRDFFNISCEQIGFQIFDERQHGLLISMLQVLQIFGKLFINAIAVLLMLKVSLNLVYLILMIFIVIGFIIIIYLLKCLKQTQVKDFS